MARRAALISKKKPKNLRISKNEAYIVNSKYLGDEPVFTKQMTLSDYATSINWYNYMCSSSDARAYIETYLKNQARTAELKKLKTVNDIWIPTSAAWAARLISRGFALPEGAHESMENKLKSVLNSRSTTAVVKATVEQPKVSIQERMKEKSSDLIGDIESLIDSSEPFSLYEWLKKKEVPASYCAGIIAYYAPWLDELLEAMDTKDEQLKYAYSRFTKKQLKERVLFFSKLLEDAERYGSNTKKARAPRKPRTPKIVTAEKKLKNLKFQKEAKEFQLVSVNPEKIIGAQELWTFNTKYKLLTVLRALDRGGLQVKGTSITGYNEETSVSKRIGRKPEEIVKKVLTGGKLMLRKVTDGLKDASLAYRINENTILLKVVN